MAQLVGSTVFTAALIVSLLCCICSRQRTAFKSASTLRTALVRVKDPIPIEQKSGVAYEVPCSCGKVYIGETKRTLETRMKEHRAAARLGQLEKSAVAEHAWQDGHTIDWS